MLNNCKDKKTLAKGTLLAQKSEESAFLFCIIKW